MRYRLEMLDDHELVINNVDMDLVLGFVQCRLIIDPQGQITGRGCMVLNKDKKSIAMLTMKNYLETAPEAVASHEERLGYPGFKGGNEQFQRNRLEYLLGSVLADTAAVIARAVFEYANGGLTAETKERYLGLIDQLYRIWFASRFGSYDAERRGHEPYFVHPYPQGPRMSFPAAAQDYGMWELKMRFPEASEAALKEILLLPLEMLDCTLRRLAPPPSEAFMALVQQAASAAAKHKTS
jgi:hypothetical protein